MKRFFKVSAVWDSEAEVFYSQSDIEGFHIEASDLDEFEDIMMDVAPDLIVLTHRTASENDVYSSKEMIPVILWQYPKINKAAG